MAATAFDLSGKSNALETARVSRAVTARPWSLIPFNLILAVRNLIAAAFHDGQWEDQALGS